LLFFFSTPPPPPPTYPLSLHDALPISLARCALGCSDERRGLSPPGSTRRLVDPLHPTAKGSSAPLGFHKVEITPAPSLRQRQNRSEEHTSELQSRFDLVCRLLLEKKKK